MVAGGDCFASLAMTTDPSVHPQGFELAMQRRAFHADEFGRARDVAAEAADLRLEIFALEGLAGVAQRHSHQVFAPVAGRHTPHHQAYVPLQPSGLYYPFR